MKKNLLFIYFIAATCFTQNLCAQTLGDYRSATSGDWGSASTWETFNGLAWMPAVTPPNVLSGTITVRDSIVVSENDSADQIEVPPGAVLNILDGVVFKLLNGPGTDLLCNGRLIIGSGAVLDATNNDLSLIHYSSADVLEINGGIVPFVTFNAETMQTVHGNGSGYFGQAITLNNGENLVVTGSVSFAGVNFENGKVLAPGNFVIGQFTGTNFSGMGEKRFIDGLVTCIVFDQTPAVFELPLGKDDNYMPVTFKLTLAAGAPQSGFGISIKNGAPPPLALPANLTDVSNVHYYTITNPNNAQIAKASLQLSYDSTDGVSDPAHLRIAKSNNDSDWVSIGGTGTTVTEGTITSVSNFKTFGDFVLANFINGTNTLPLRITSFTASVAKQSVLLYWTTESEINTGHFNIDRRDQSSSTWQVIGSTPAKPGSSGNNYNFDDASVKTAADYYYRLNEIDKDGASYLSKTLLVHLQDGPGKMEVTGMFPNPTRDVVHYSVSAATDDVLTVTITGLNGKMVKSQKTVANQPQQVSISELGAGTYLLTITNERTKEKVVKKVVKL